MKTDEELMTDVIQAIDELYADVTDHGETYQKDLVALVRAARAMVDAESCDEGVVKYNLKEALEQFEPWLEQDDDPRAMGWVDGRGRP